MDTMGYHKARPLQSNIDISGASLRHVTSEYNRLKQTLTDAEGAIKVAPESEALWFYVQQHAMSLIERSRDSEEPLADFLPFVEKYHNTAQIKTLRMFYYLLLICTRESRHMKGYGKADLFKKYPDIKSFHDMYVQDSSADSAVNAVLKNAPDVTLGEYTNFLVDAFRMPDYDGGFGGEAWEEVATPLRDFVHGKISAEIMMDTAFTLAHNNGPIFNKGMLFNNYNGSSLQMILDVQRSGQIPQLIAHPQPSVTKYITADLKKYVEEFANLESGFSGEVDWSLVKDIHGSISFPSLVKKEAEGGIKAKLAAMKKAAEDKAKKLKAQAAKAALLKGSFELMPGLSIPKSKRSQK